jgi:hypothetical protein
MEVKQEVKMEVKHFVPDDSTWQPKLSSMSEAN